MRNFFALLIAGLTALASAQIPEAPVQFPETKQSNTASPDTRLKEMFEAKVKAEWEAIKTRTRKHTRIYWQTTIRAWKSMAGASVLKSRPLTNWLKGIFQPKLCGASG